MDTFGVTCLGHNIPRLVREGSSIMCAVRVRNTRDRNVYFQSHASFYGTPIKDTRHHLSVHVNGGVSAARTPSRRSEMPAKSANKRGQQRRDMPASVAMRTADSMDSLRAGKFFFDHSK